MEAAASNNSQQASCLCNRCNRRNQIPIAGLFHTGDAKLSDKLSSTYQRPQQMGYPATINENLDELDEFALGFGHEDPIQEGENPPFMASSDSVSLSGSHYRSRSSTIQLLSSQPHERLQQGFSNQNQRRPRLVTMGDVVDKLWDKADDELDDDRESVMSAMRASFYRPSMIQSTKRTDIDLTATWHGDMSDTLMQPMIDGFDDKAVVGSSNGSFAAASLFSLDSSFHSQSHSKSEFMSTYGHPLLTGGSEDGSTIFGGSSSRSHKQQGRAKPLASVPMTSSFRKLKHNFQKAEVSVKVPKSKRWSWARCVESLKKLKIASGSGKESKSKKFSDASRPPLHSGPTHRKKAKECFSCLGPRAPSEISSFDMTEEIRGPDTPLYGATPFLTTSALFDDPKTPGPLSPSDSLLFYKMSTCGMGTMNSKGFVTTPDLGGTSNREAPDMVELWEDSDVASSHGSFMLSRNCWVPPVLKTDKEYEASRLCSNNIRRDGQEFSEYDSIGLTQCRKLSPAIDKQWMTLSSKSSWDIHSVSIDKPSLEEVCYMDPGV